MLQEQKTSSKSEIQLDPELEKQFPLMSSLMKAKKTNNFISPNVQEIIKDYK